MKRNKKSLSCLLLLFFIFSLVSVCAESTLAMVGPVREWKFEEADGTVAKDTSGQGKHGTIAKAEQRVVDEARGKVLQFAGAADYVQVPPKFFHGLGNWSFSAYFKPTTAAGEEAYIYSAKVADPRGVEEEARLYFSISITADNRIKVAAWHNLREIFWDSYETAPNVIKRNEWNHLHITLKNATETAQSGIVKCYINGTLVDDQGKLGTAFVKWWDTYGAAWTAGTATTLTRLEGSVKEKSAEGTTGSNFNKIYPWKEMKLCNVADDGTINAYYGDEKFKRDGSNGQVMIQIPKFYYKRTYIEGKHEFLITDKPTTGFNLHPAFKRSGLEKPYLLVGAYEAGVEDNKLTSKTGVTPAVNKTRAEFRQLAQARGAIGWNQIDALTYSALQMLCLVEYANTDCQIAIGNGRVNAGSAIATGGCDGLNGASGPGTDNTVSYRGLENLWGNVWEFIDGINIEADRKVYIAESNFADDTFTGAYQATGFTLPAADNYCTDWTHSATTVDWLFLPSGVGGSDTTHIPDYFTQATGNTVAMVGGAWDSGTKAGLFSWDVKNPFTHKADNIGARLMRIPANAVWGTVTAEVGGGAIAGATVAVKSGGTTIASTTTAADGTYIINNIPVGTYTVKFTAENYLSAVTTDVIVNDATQVNKTLAPETGIGASWRVGSGTALTRLAGAVGKTVEPEQNDFDSLYPWSGIKLCNVADNGTVKAHYGDAGFVTNGDNGQVMVEIPKFYYRHIYDGGEHEFFVTDQPAPGFKLHPAFKRGADEKNYIYVGAYEAGEAAEAAGIVLTSVSGVAPVVNQTRAQFRSTAQTRGTGWSQIDAQTWSAIQMLYLIEYADTNCQTKIGAGRTNTSNAVASGRCDGLNGASGVGLDATVSYRGMENLWGNVWDFVDGINIEADRKVYIAEHNFADDTFDGDYQATGFILPSSDNYITDWTYSEAYDWLLLPSSVGGSASTYIPDYFTQAVGNRVLLAGCSWSGNTQAGLFCSHFAWNRDNKGTSVGARILYLP